ncbi:hypothetical protein [Mycoplasmopsis primatum]|uniref:hypothetical protein n=1 Tax=Mycoplasmopsis primatum TaxID=55604 RepID=UPI000496FE4D|nr:hypothetical protein [Mycoplasmopsis primatum]
MNNLPYNFQSKLNNILVKSNVASLLSDIERQMLSNTYMMLFNSYYGVNNYQMQVHYVKDPRFFNYLNQYTYTYFYNLMMQELNRKMWEFQRRIGQAIYWINRNLYI